MRPQVPLPASLKWPVTLNCGKHVYNLIAMLP